MQIFMTLLTVFRKSVMLSLITLFLGMFLTDFCILHIFVSDFVSNFHNILEEKRCVDDFVVFLM